MRFFTVVFLCLLALTPPSHAATVSGVTFPDTYPVDGQTLHLNGMGLRTVTFLGVHAYVAGLYLLQPSHDPAAIEAAPGPKVLLLYFLHSASKAQVEKQYHEGEVNNCGAGQCKMSALPAFQRLVEIAPAVEVGDTTTYIITQKGVRVFANSRPLGDFPDPDLALYLLNGFIGAHPPSESLKTALLGLSPQ
jgi:Chalcone isomerase-like